MSYIVGNVATTFLETVHWFDIALIMDGWDWFWDEIDNLFLNVKLVQLSYNEIKQLEFLHH